MMKLVDQTTFDSQYFGRQLYLEKGAFDTAGFDWRVVDQVFREASASASKFKVLWHGVEVSDRLDEKKARDAGSIGALKLDELYQVMAEGATAVLNDVDLTSPYIRAVCRALSQYARAPATANAYVSKGGTSGFGAHWDVHDVFAVQLIGRKRWQCYQPTFVQPTRSHSLHKLKHECPPSPVLDIVLEAGDVLYLPRGWWHKVVPLEGEETFHLAVGLHPPSIVDYGHWVLDKLADCDMAPRKSIHMAHFLDRSAATNQANIDTAGDLTRAAMRNADFIREYLATLKAKRGASRSIRLSSEVFRTEPAPLGPDDVIMLSDLMLIDRAQSKVYLASEVIDVDDRALKFFDQLDATGRVSMRSLLTAMDESARPAFASLVRKLERKGLLEVLNTNDILPASMGS